MCVDCNIFIETFYFSRVWSFLNALSKRAKATINNRSVFTKKTLAATN